uniref:LOB domain-containing protein n=1 Tax=Oryza rufipogon TaxID=4529 RepID=A0A0E0MY84_ORYRU
MADPSRSTSSGAAKKPSPRNPRCAACKFLRRACSPEECRLAPHFPASQPERLQSVERVFGMRKVLELAHKAGPEYLDDILSSIVYEAEAWGRDPVWGPTGVVGALELEIGTARADLAVLQGQDQDQPPALAPYFPAGQPPAQFGNVHRLFRLNNVLRMMEETRREERDDLMAAIVYEADAWARDPRYGVAGVVRSLTNELARVRLDEIAFHLLGTDETYDGYKEEDALAVDPVSGAQAGIGVLGGSGADLQENTGILLGADEPGPGELAVDPIKDVFDIDRLLAVDDDLSSGTQP